MHWCQSRSGKSIIIGGFIAVSAYIAWLTASASDQDRNREKTVNQHQITKETDVIRGYTGSVKKELSSPDPSNYNSEYKETRRYKYAYLASQIGLAAFAAIGIAVAICSLWSLNKSVIAAKIQSNVARTQLYISDRPWLGLTQDTQFVAILPPSPFAEIDTKLVIKNFGQSVPLNAKIAFSGADNIRALDTFIPRICQRWTRPAANVKTTTWGYAIFPNGIIEQPWGVSLARDQKSIDNRVPINRVWAYGCITYDDQFHRPHWTRFCYIGMPNGNFSADVSTVGVSRFQLYERYNDTDTEPEPK
jgi:hypothetical protein